MLTGFTRYALQLHTSKPAPRLCAVADAELDKDRADAALDEPFTGTYCGRGARPKYGEKVDVRKMKRNI
jgi:hypothetical protein